MKRIVLQLFSAFLFLSIESYAMEYWDGYDGKSYYKQEASPFNPYVVLKSEKETFDKQEDIENIELLLPQDLKEAFDLAKKYRKLLNDITQHILIHYQDLADKYNKIDLFSFQEKSEEATEKMKQLFMNQIHEEEELNYLPYAICNGADIDARTAHVGTFIRQSPPLEGPFWIIVNLLKMTYWMLPIGLVQLTHLDNVYRWTHEEDKHSIFLSPLNKALNKEVPDEKVMEYLLAHKANVNQQAHSVDAIKMCLKNKLKLECNSQLTPLSMAIKYGAINNEAISIMRCLVSYDADIVSSTFSKQALKDDELFLVLFNKYLDRLAKIGTSTEIFFDKPYKNAAREIAALIVSLPDDRKTAFLVMLNKNMERIVKHYEHICAYLKVIAEDIGLIKKESFKEVDSKEETEKEDALEKANKDVVQSIKAVAKYDLNEVQQFCFDRKNVNKLLAALFQTVPLDALRNDKSGQQQLEYYLDFLFNLGAYINIYFRYNALFMNPLHVAIHSDNTYFVDYLLKKSANPNMTDSQGVRPLQMLKKGQINIANLLLQNGANVLLTNKKGEKALDHLTSIGIALTCASALNLKK